VSDAGECFKGRASKGVLSRFEDQERGYDYKAAIGRDSCLPLRRCLPKHFLPTLPDKSGFIVPPSYTSFDRSREMLFMGAGHVNYYTH
jgi:hypothetical protein